MNFSKRIISNILLKSSVSRLVFSRYYEINFTHKYRLLCFENNFNNNPMNVVRNMAQKSITSFFKISPKESAEKEQQKEVASPPKTKSEPTTNGTAKKPSKRQRLDSSESQSPKKTKETSPVASDKKKKVKRQRIESSDSESERSKSPEIKSSNKSDQISPATSPKTTKSPTITLKEEKDDNTKEESLLKTPKVKKETVAKTTPKTAKKKKETASYKQKNSLANTKNKDKDVRESCEKVSEENYDPSKSKYHPINDACWSAGQDVPYLALAKTLEAIEATSSRLKMVEILSNYFRSVIVLTPEDLLPSVYMCLNQLAPAYHSVELGIAETYLMKAISRCTGQTLAQLKAAAARLGALAAAAEQARASQRTMFAPPKLTLKKVFATLKEIAHMTGHASVEKKICKIQSLYVACRHSEARYLIRSLEGKLRIGLAEQSVLQALGQAVALTPPEQDGVKILDASKGMSPEQFKSISDEHVLIIKTTYCECPNYELLIPALLRHGARALPQHCRLTPGLPLKPMLAHPTKGVAEVLSRFEGSDFTCEWKYDGERAQLHVPQCESDEDGKQARADLARASVFSRNQENNTSKYPDVLGRLGALLKESVNSCVLDCEAVAFDTATKQILPFQVLSTRKRKDAVVGDIRVQVCVFVFDLLYLNGRPLVTQPLAERRALLYQHFNEVEGEWEFARHREVSAAQSAGGGGAELVQQFLDEAVKGSCEGLMLKTLHGPSATYEIARRSHNWLKLKKDYLEGVGDSVDAVVVGGWWGKGRRGGVLGGFLLAAYDPDTEEYQSLCKIGTGFSDEDLRRLTDDLTKHTIDEPKPYYRFDNSHCADVWFAPALVWEVRCADLSLSPAHRAAQGLVEPDKGISLRFPRFIRSRDDKTPEQATSAQQLAQLYLQQDQVKNCATKRDANDFY